MNPFGTGKVVIFQVFYSHPWKNRLEILPMAVLAVICKKHKHKQTNINKNKQTNIGAIVGVIFIRLNIRMTAYRKFSWLKNWPVVEVIILQINRIKKNNETIKQSNKTNINISKRKLKT